MAFTDVVAADFTENRPGNEDTMAALANNSLEGLSGGFTVLAAGAPSCANVAWAISSFASSESG